jgi:hypothetical protein
VALRPLDGADGHDGWLVGSEAQLGADGRRLGQQLGAELVQVDPVVHNVYAGGRREAGADRARDRNHVAGVALYVACMQAAQGRLRAEHLAHDPHHGHPLAASGCRPCQQHAGVQVEHVRPCLAQPGPSPLQGQREGRHEPRQHPRPDPRVRRGKEGAAGRDDLDRHAKRARVVRHRARFCQHEPRLEALAVEGA